MPRILACLLAVSAVTGVTVTPAFAAEAPATKPLYTTAETPLGDLLDDAEAKAVLEKHIPAVVGKEGIDMARGMTLKQLQSYAGDELTDAKLAEIDADLAKLGKH